MVIMYMFELNKKIITLSIWTNRQNRQNRKIFTEKRMRKVTEKQLEIGQTPISKIEIDLKSRDEIPQLLLGLQFIDSNKELRSEVYQILEGIIPQNVNPRNGRPGMDLWKIFVLGTLRLNCNWDYDKVHHISNEHYTVRQFLGHSRFEFDEKYSLQCIKDNVSLLTPEILDRINKLVVKAGHRLVGHTTGEALRGRCDSFVLETDVHFPTDINLLLDAVRKVIFLTARACEQLNITDWRQYRHLYKNVKVRFNRANRMKTSTSKDENQRLLRENQIKEAHAAYVDLCEFYVSRARECIYILDGMGIETISLAMVIENYIAHADRQIDQIRRRVINGDSIPHHEKVFSIFEEHTEWIKKGKAGVPVELGLRVCILEDQYGFILHHHVMEQQTDDKVAFRIVEETKRKFSDLDSCSFDKGFYSPENKRSLKSVINNVILPKKGKLSKKDMEEEYSEEFKNLRRKHSAVESGINALENHGLDRCRDHGIKGFKRYVALSVLARNIQILGSIIRKKKLKQQKRKDRETLLIAA
jgi:hypothetical protein